MMYRTIALTVVVADDDSEAYIQGLNDALDRLDEQFHVCNGEIKQSEAESPENAEELAASGS